MLWHTGVTGQAWRGRGDGALKLLLTAFRSATSPRVPISSRQFADRRLQCCTTAVNAAWEDPFPLAYLGACECLCWHSWARGVWSYRRVQQVANTHTHRQGCRKFLSYQQKVDYWHPLQWLHTINVSNKANVGGGCSLTQPQHNLDGCMSGHNLVVLPWQPVTRDAQHATVASVYTQTHTHRFSDGWWMFGSQFSCNRTWNIPWFALCSIDKHTMIRLPCLFCTLFPFKSPQPPLFVRFLWWMGGE